jgi:hypothetical protein
MQFASPQTECCGQDRNSMNTETQCRRDRMQNQTASLHRDIFIFECVEP